MDLLAQSLDHDLMVKPIEALSDITLDKPAHTLPVIRYLAQCGMASSAGPESVGTFGELYIIVRVKQHANYLSQ
ncbi:hypothetical protein GCM10027091_70470 [Streptomyces daliensis]